MSDADQSYYEVDGAEAPRSYLSSVDLEVSWTLIHLDHVVVWARTASLATQPRLDGASQSPADP